MESRPLKVSEVNNYIKRVFLSDMILSNLSVEGEISNFKHHYSGHMYFNLKDEKSRIKAVMFKGDNEKLKFKLEEGKKVVATGYVSLYEKEGDYQLYVRQIKESGLGELYKAFEDLKRKLELEGLFLESNKKPIPFMPKKIGVVTSSTGAAIRDIITVIKRRFPPCNILIYPSLVQGIQAPKEIIKGLIYLDNLEDVDLIITGRGGGSIEELNAFNDEELARTIHSLNTPIISAVGHETDFTIADFVADLRAATPSAAAELAVPNINSLKNELNNLHLLYSKAMFKILREFELELNHLNKSLNIYSPINKIKNRKQDLDILLRELDYSIEKKIINEGSKLLGLKNKLDLLNPIIGLDRGYGIITNKKGELIKSIEDAHIGENINIIFKDGKIQSTINNIDKGGLVGE